MKKAAMKMDFENNTATNHGKGGSFKSHNVRALLHSDRQVRGSPVESVCAVKLDDLNRQNRFKTLLKLHRQFAHPCKNRLTALLKDAGVWR